MDTEDDTLTGAEFSCIREHLGLTNAWTSDYLGVAERSVMRWNYDQSPVPIGVAEELRGLETQAAAAVERACEWLAERDPSDRELITYRTDDVLRLVNPSDPFPASWHRAIAARIRERVEGVRIVFAPEE